MPVVSKQHVESVVPNRQAARTLCWNNQSPRQHTLVCHKWHTGVLNLHPAMCIGVLYCPHCVTHERDTNVVSTHAPENNTRWGHSCGLFQHGCFCSVVSSSLCYVWQCGSWQCRRGSNCCHSNYLVLYRSSHLLHMHLYKLTWANMVGHYHPLPEVHSQLTSEFLPQNTVYLSRADLRAP